MTNQINIDKDILLTMLVDCLGGGSVDWQNKEVELLHYYLGKKYYNCNELIIKCIHNARDNLYRGVTLHKKEKDERRNSNHR